MIKKIYLPMREVWLRFLVWGNLLKKEMAIHSSILAWKIPRPEESGRLQFMRLRKRWTRLSN